MSKLGLDFIAILSIRNKRLYRTKKNDKKLLYGLIRNIIDAEIEFSHHIWHNYLVSKRVDKIYLPGSINNYAIYCFANKHLHRLPKRRGANIYE